MTHQLSFDWPTGVALGEDDFFVSDANGRAYAMLQAPDSWPNRKLVITGPEGCGKSHLARIFQTRTGAEMHNASTLPQGYRPRKATVIVEDMQTLPATAEETMFHLHNHLAHTGGTLLLTSEQPPVRWPIALPDLASRMQATTIAQITNPDDPLIQALLMKLFADRGIAPKPNLVSYLAARIERSFAAAADIVARLDETALTTGDKINRKLAKRLLDKVGAPGDTAP